MRLIKTFLALTFRASTNHLSLYSFLASFGSCDLRLCLIDTGQRFVYARILQLALAEIFLNPGTRTRNCRSGLIYLGLIVIVLQLDEEVALVNLLVVSHIHRAHNTCHLGTERSKIATNVSIICNLFDLATFPRIPVTCDGDQNDQSENHHENWRCVALPLSTSARNGLICTDLWRHRFRFGRRGFSGHWRSGH